MANQWWQRGIVYQVYPRSFQDSNGDGVGDLAGITSRLDYLRWLGVDAVWLSPIYPSPMADFGYDVSNYCDIDPLFGTLADFDALLAAAHARELRVILDFVPNHTSSQHPWFLESRSSRDNPKRDWYLWRDPGPDGGPPNNWRSMFGGGAWELDETTGQYYYHAFLKEQPDLNWRNPDVQEAMMNVLRFWLDRGVDGFRIDVIWHLIKDHEFRDNPNNPDYAPGQSPYDELLPVYTSDRPEVHDIIRMMRKVFDGYQDRLMVGEIYLPIEKLVTYYGEDGTEVHLPYNFLLVVLPWNAARIAQAVASYEAMLPQFAWPNWVLGNHDQHRIVSRVGAAQARVAAMLLLTLRGTPTIYYGDEIAMHDVPIAHDQIQDPYEKQVPGLGLGRDPQRTPMQWNGAEPNAGFTGGKPWLPLPGDIAEISVERERDDPSSMLTLYRRLIEMRRNETALEIGEYAPVHAEGELIVFIRKVAERRFLIALNLSSAPASFDLAALQLHGTIRLSTHLDRDAERVEESLALRADEGLIVLID